jgi:hypothetical protein
LVCYRFNVFRMLLPPDAPEPQQGMIDAEAHSSLSCLDCRYCLEDAVAERISANAETGLTRDLCSCATHHAILRRCADADPGLS